ncbi:MAG: LysM peptidoglycan-binding domain-containing protein, partial [Candidatus Omnitrophica bacterium]|nr:LysM peptidoglycan-binding domain-containing protein [Candidatus Omnitrophota bacterium]
TWQDIYNANRATIKDKDLIYPGQKLVIPLSAEKKEKPVISDSKQAQKRSLAVKTIVSDPAFKPAEEALAKVVGATKPVLQAIDADVQKNKEALEKRLKELNGDKKVIYAGNLEQYKALLRGKDNYAQILKLIHDLDKKYDAVFVVGSIDPDDLHKPIRIFPNEHTKKDPTQKPNPLLDLIKNISNWEVRLFVPPANQLADYSRIEQDWEEITIVEAEKFEKERRSPFILVKGFDEEGQFKGVLWAGIKAQREYLDLIQTAHNERDIIGKLNRIFNESNPIRQRELIKQLFDKAKLPNTPYLYTAANIRTNKWGNIAEVLGFIPSGAIELKEKEVFHKASGKNIKTDLLVFILQEEGKKIELKYWPNKREQAWWIFSRKLAQELERENNPELLYSVSDRYLEQDDAIKHHLQRGDIFVGRSFFEERLIKSNIDLFNRHREVLSQKEYSQYLNKKMVLETLLVPVNIGLGYVNSWLPVASVSRLIFDLVYRPDKILPGAPSQEEKIKFLAGYMYLEVLEKKSGRDYFNDKDREWLDKELTKVSDEQLKPYMERAEEKFKGLITKIEAKKLDYYLQQRKGQITAEYLLNMAGLILDISGTVLSQDKTLVFTDEFKGTMQIVYEEPRQKVLVEILQQKYVSLTGELNIPQFVSLLTQGKGMPFVHLKDFASDFNFLEKAFSVFAPTIDLLSVINAAQKALGPPDESWDPIFKNHPTSPRIKLYLLGFPISLIFEKQLVEHLIAIEEGKVGKENTEVKEEEKPFAYEITHGWFKSKAIDYTQQEFYHLPKGSGIKRIPLGTIGVPGADKELQVPIYLIINEQPNGERTYRVFILTRKGLREYKRQVEQDLKIYD